jgi:hypothetical protein
MKLLVHRCSSLSCFLCVARAFLLFIKVLVLLSWDLTRDCKRAFQHVNNNENKKASVPIHSIQPYGLLFSVGDVSEKLKECARVFSLLRFYLLGQQQKDLFKINSTWIKFPWVHQNSLLQNTRPWTFTLNNLALPLSVYFSVSRGKRTEETILLPGLGVGISKWKKNAKCFLEQGLNHFIQWKTLII